MRILWVSNAPWAASGYGVQTKLFTPRIRELGHEVGLLNFYGHEGGIIAGSSGPMYPRGGHPYGQDVQGFHAQHFGAEVMITLIDAWVLEPQTYPPQTVWCPWFPIDHDPIPPMVLEKVKMAFLPIVYSKFGLAKMEEAGLEALYVPHGVDTETYKPMDKKAAREAMGWPRDRFIVGMVAANVGIPSRKAFPESMLAFKALLKDIPDALLYVHAFGQKGERQGINLRRDAEIMGIANSIIWSDEYRGMLGYDDESMRAIYSGMDVLLACSRGEGFGVPILEAQACGTPVITGEWTAMDEINFSGWKHPKAKAWPEWTYQGSLMFVPSAEVLHDLLLKAAKSTDREAMAKVARECALEYDAERVTERYWKPALDEIARRMERRNKIAALMAGAVA